MSFSVSTYTHKTSCIPRLVDRSRPVDKSRPVETFCEKWRKNWTEEGMEQAIKSITLRGMSVREAAEQYNIPKSTIYDRLSGKVLPNMSCGAPKYLTDNEERELATFLIGCSKIGYGKTRSEVLLLVERLLQSRGITRTVSNGWWERFRIRHPDITLRTPSSLCKARALATNHEVIDQYFDILEEALTVNNLFDKPHQVFNLDETGVPLDPKPLKVVASHREQNPSNIRAGTKSQISVVGCISAGGIALPPMIIWSGKSLSPKQTIGEIPGTLHGFSARGWMDRELFNLWFSKLFLHYAPKARPLLLLLDGHSSHYCPDTIRLAAKEKVVIFTFPPNTTHLTQPLDKGVFGPLKLHWRKECHQFCSNNPHVAINKYNFCSIFSNAWMQAMTVHNIRNSFSTTGVYPFNRDAIKLPIESSVTTDFAHDSGLYIPLYTPKKSRHLCSTFVSPTVPPPSFSSPVSSPISSVSDDDDLVFTKEEVVRFERRWENGYDIKTDTRYNAWLKAKGLDSPSPHDDQEQSTIHQPSYRSSFSRFLTLPSPPQSNPGEQVYPDRVITSAENLKLLQDKEEKKQEKERQKQERIRQRAAEQRRQQKKKVIL